jgi:meso-butanediol dehydrogenase/(S,S)-butanediol dehydrogenase/diacetyl reductase
VRGLDGKIAIVTGAARRRGIGRATALRLADEGCNLVLADIAGRYPDFPHYETGSRDELEECAELVRQKGRKAEPVRCDVSIEADVQGMVAKAIESFGRIDVLVNVAGGAGFGLTAGPFHLVTEPEWDRVVGTNLKGVWLCSKHVAAHMLDRGGGGAIVSIASQAGKTGFPMLAVYSAAKHGVVGLTRAMAAELGPSGIRANAVCPGTVDTDLLNKDGGFAHMLAAAEGTSPDDALQRFIRRNIPMGRLEQPEDVAAYVAFLCSDDAGYVTAQAVNTTGGQEQH